MARMTSYDALEPAPCPDRTTPRDQFVVLMEDIARQDGMSPIAGRILGYLMMSDTAVAFADLAKALSISRGSVSENTNFLEELGLIARCRIDGDRRDHFRYRDDAGEALIARQRRRTIEIVGALDAMRRRNDLGALQRQRITFMSAFFKMTLAASEEMLAGMQRSGCLEPDATVAGAAVETGEGQTCLAASDTPQLTGSHQMHLPEKPAGTNQEETDPE